MLSDGAGEIIETHPRIGQRMRDRRILLGLDDEPAGILGLPQCLEQRRIPEGAIARHGEDTGDDGIEEARIGRPHAVQDLATHVLAMDMIDARMVAPRDGERVGAGIRQMPGIEEEADGIAFTDYHHTIADLYMSLVRASYRVDLMMEPEPTPSGPRSPFWREPFTKVPRTLIVRARKEGN